MERQEAFTCKILELKGYLSIFKRKEILGIEYHEF